MSVDGEAVVERGKRGRDKVGAEMGSVFARIGGSCGVNGEEEVVKTGVAVVGGAVEVGRLVVLRRGELSSREAMEGIVVAREVCRIVW